MTARGRVLRIVRFERTVTALEPAVAFYCDALGFERIPDGPDGQSRILYGRSAQIARLRLGAQELWLTSFDPPGAPYPENSTSADLWFQHFAIVVNNMPAAYKRLCAYPHTPISKNGPVTLPPATGSVTAYKFRDPDGHPLELIYFPLDTGDVRWQDPSLEGPTIGIDHSAISAADADRSIAFYRDLLGLTVGGRQTNSGPEQAQLDALHSSAVQVVALDPRADTPHVELLAYNAGVPFTGRFLEPWDIAADRLVMAVDDLAVIRSRLQPASFGLTKSGQSESSLVVHDPDGHTLVLARMP